MWRTWDSQSFLFSFCFFERQATSFMKNTMFREWKISQKTIKKEKRKISQKQFISSLSYRPKATMSKDLTKLVQKKKEKLKIQSSVDCGGRDGAVYTSDRMTSEFWFDNNSFSFMGEICFLALINPPLMAIYVCIFVCVRVFSFSYAYPWRKDISRSSSKKLFFAFVIRLWCANIIEWFH